MSGKQRIGRPSRRTVRRDTVSFVLGWGLIWLMVLRPDLYNLAVLSVAGGVIGSPIGIRALEMITGRASGTSDSSGRSASSVSSSSSVSDSGADD